MNMRLQRDCMHGQLARSCEICALETEVEELRAKLAAMEKQEPVAWSVTVGKEFKNCIEITHCKSDAVAEYIASIEATDGSEFEGVHYKIHNLYAAAGAAPVPEGWQLVPIEPTPEMCDIPTWDFNRFYSPHEIYKAMLAAAPKDAP